MGTPLSWPYDTLPDREAARQTAAANSDQQFTQQMLRMNADDQAFAMQARRNADYMSGLLMSAEAQGIMGTSGILPQTILAERSAGAQPQSGGGPGQPVIYPVQQQLPITNNGPPPVYFIGPTGVPTKV